MTGNINITDIRFSCNLRNYEIANLQHTAFKIITIIMKKQRVPRLHKKGVKYDTSGARYISLLS